MSGRFANDKTKSNTDEIASNNGRKTKTPGRVFCFRLYPVRSPLLKQKMRKENPPRTEQGNKEEQIEGTQQKPQWIVSQGYSRTYNSWMQQSRLQWIYQSRDLNYE